MGTFVFRWPHAANHVYVTGTFDDWGKTEKLEKVGDVFEKEVTLPSAEEKYDYKFVVDDVWTTDHEAPQEEDGHRNVNNILTPAQIKKISTTMSEITPNGDSGTSKTPVGSNGQAVTAAGGLAGAGGVGSAMLAGVTPQSTTANLAGAVPKEAAKDAEGLGDQGAAAVPDAHEPSVSPPGAFPETPAHEAQEFSVKPIPASEGSGNPISVPAGEKLPDSSAIHSNTVDSTATTSKEGYEKDASAAFPAAAAAGGVGIAGVTGAAAYAHEKKAEADSFGVNPIAASAGIGNPISVPAGAKLPEQSSFNPNTVQSTATTSKEAYDKDASAPLLPPSATGGATGAATDSAFSVPEKSKNLIPESSLPMGGEAKDTTDTGPFISTAAPTSSTSYLASAVPLEPKREATVVEDEAPSATLSGPAPTVPEVVNESFSEAHQSPEAAGSAEAVGEKALVEKELLKKVKSTDAAGEPAPSPAVTGTSSGPVSSVASNVPAVVKESISESHQPAEAAAAQEVVNEKRDMESQLLREVKSTDAVGEPAPSASAAAAGISAGPVSSVASNVPAVVKESISEAHQPAEAAAAQEVVNEKREVESELLRTVKSTDAAGEPAPTATAATTENAPTATKEAAVHGAAALGSPTVASDAPTHAAPIEAATPGVETGHPAPDAPTQVPTTPAVPAAPEDQSPLSPEPNAPATPAKAITTDHTPTKSTVGPAAAGITATPSATTSPVSTVTKDQKKKNRRSFFGKIKDKFKDL